MLRRQRWRVSALQLPTELEIHFSVCGTIRNGSIADYRVWVESGRVVVVGYGRMSQS